MMGPVGLAFWLAVLPFRIAFALGARRTLALVCVFVLAVTLHGIAQDLGLVQPFEGPAIAAPARPRSPAKRPPAGQPAASRAARADIPRSYLPIYYDAARDCRGLSWSILAGIGKVESNHGRSTLPGVRSGWNFAGAAGPMQFGIGTGKAGNSWARYGRDYDRDGRRSVYDPGDAIPAAARYLCAHGAPGNLNGAIHGYNHSWSYVALVRRIARGYAK